MTKYKNVDYLTNTLNLGDYIKNFNDSELKSFVEKNQNYIFISCSGVYDNWWDENKNCVTITHGLDEDPVIPDNLKLWEGNKEEWLNVPLSKITNNIVPYDTNDLKNFTKLTIVNQQFFSKFYKHDVWS